MGRGIYMQHNTSEIEVIQRLSLKMIFKTLLICSVYFTVTQSCINIPLPPLPTLFPPPATTTATTTTTTTTTTAAGGTTTTTTAAGGTTTTTAAGTTTTTTTTTTTSTTTTCNSKKKKRSLNDIEGLNGFNQKLTAKYFI